MPFFDKLKENEMKRAFVRNMHCELDEWIETLLRKVSNPSQRLKKMRGALRKILNNAAGEKN